MEKAELYAVLGGAVTVISALIGVAYGNVVERIKRNEDMREKDMQAVWTAVGEQREDVKKLLANSVTKDDLTRSEDRIIRALRPATSGAD